ncbi:MAG: sigma factor [Polyangiales bacterium]
MTPSEIVASLRAEPPEATWAALYDLVSRLARRVLGGYRDLDDLVQRVMFKLAQHCANDRLGIKGTDNREVTGYLTAMLKNARRDEHRKGGREVLVDTAPEPPAPAPEREPELESEAELERLRALLDKVCAAMLEGLSPAYREGRARARREVEALYFEERTVEEALRASGELDGASEGEVKKAIDRAMKQHQRYRDGMIQTADEMLRGGEIDEAERRAVERAVLEMKRR